MASSLSGFAAKFRQTLQELAESEITDAPALRESVKQAAEDLARDQFRALASSFDSQSLEVRRETARTVAQLARGLALDDVLSYATSPSRGERIAGAIALRTHLQADSSLCVDVRVRTTIKELLDDPRLGVRYRAVEGVKAAQTGDRVPATDGDFEITATRVVRYPGAKVKRQPFTTRYDQPPADH